MSIDSLLPVYLKNDVIAIIWCVLHQFHDRLVRCVSQILLVSVLSVRRDQKFLNDATEELEKEKLLDQSRN